jgi:hypothetical protein
MPSAPANPVQREVERMASSTDLFLRSNGLHEGEKSPFERQCGQITTAESVPSVPVEIFVYYYSPIRRSGLQSLTPSHTHFTCLHIFTQRDSRGGRC